jgi:hypothetical protein
MLVSCIDKPKLDKIILVNPNQALDSIYLSEIVDSIKYIKLQTDSIVKLGKIHSIFVKEKFIYCVDLTNQAVFVFNHSGKIEAI